MDQSHRWGRLGMAPEIQPAEEEPFFLGNSYNPFSPMLPTCPWHLNETFSSMRIEPRSTSPGLGFGFASPHPVIFQTPQLDLSDPSTESFRPLNRYNLHDSNLAGSERQAPAHLELPRTPTPNLLQQMQCSYPFSLCEEGCSCSRCYDQFCRRATDPRVSHNLLNDISIMRPERIDQLGRAGNFHEPYPARDAAVWYNLRDPNLVGSERQAPAHLELPRTPTLNLLQQMQCSYPFSLCEEGYSCSRCNDQFCRRATDLRVSHNLLNDINNMGPDRIDQLFDLFKNKIHKMMMHTPTNLVVMSLFDRLSENQTDEILVKLCRGSHLFQICNNTYGSKVMQKLIGRITLPRQKTLLTNALFPHTMQLATKSDGYGIILCILKSFSDKENKLILREIGSNCFRIGISKYGYGLLMHIINYCMSGLNGTYVLASVARTALGLAFHEYGNFVVQALLDQRIECLNSTVIQNLIGHFAQLSTDKYGSNVVQRCIKEAPTVSYVEDIIVKELLECSSDLFVHEFGNYVMQTALQVSKEVSFGTHQLLLQKLSANAGRLRSKNFGKKVLTRFLPRTRLTPSLLRD